MRFKGSLTTLTWYRQWPFWLTVLLNSATCLFLARLVYKYQTYPFDGDEINHALPSLLMANAIRQRQWSDFIYIFYAQSFYPPAAAALKALVFVLFDPSFLHARLFSVVCLFLAIFVIYALCVEIDSQNGRIAGLLAAMLTLIASPLLINATLSMVELPGLLISLLFLWAYVRALKRVTVGRLLIVSFLMAAVFLTKYTYGIVALLTLGLSEAMLLPVGRNRLAWRELKSRVVGRWLCLFGPFLLVMAFWFLHPDKIASFVSYTQPLPGGEPWLSVQNAGYYMHSMIIHNLPSPLFAWVAAGGLVWGVGQWRQRPLRPLLLYFVIGMGGIMLVNHPVNPRFIVTFVPAAHILTGLMIAFLWGQRQIQQKRVPAMILWGLIGLSVALSAPNTWRRWVRMDGLLEVMVETNPVINEIMAWTQQQMPPGQTVFIVNYWDQLTPNLFAWYQSMRHPADMGQPLNSIIVTPPTDESLVSTRQIILESQADYLVLFEGGPWGHPFWPEYTAALEDVLVPAARHEFTVSSFGAAQDWLDTASVTEPAWLAARRNNLHDLSIGVVIFQLQFPEDLDGS